MRGVAIRLRLSRDPASFCSRSYCIITCGRGAAIDPETVHRATTGPRIGAPFTSSQAQRRALPGALGASPVVLGQHQHPTCKDQRHAPQHVKIDPTVAQKFQPQPFIDNDSDRSGDEQRCQGVDADGGDGRP